MAIGEDPVDLLQGMIAAFIGGYLLLKLFDVVPTENIANGPFSDAYLVFTMMPWLLFFLGIVLLLTMVREVVDL